MNHNDGKSVELAMRQDHDGHDDKRRCARSRVLIGATVTTTEGPIEVRLRNLSQYGALLHCDRPPALRSEVTLERGELRAPARVVWIDGGRFGIEFEEPIDEQEVLIHGSPTQHYEAPAHCEPPTSKEPIDIHSRALTPDELAEAKHWFQPGGRNVD
jgi:hypothetical protein